MSENARNLSASYRSPTGHHTFTLPITAPCTDASTSERTNYLGELRANAKKMQADVNKFLTEKMEQDKQLQQDQTSKKADEELEEQNYGEEQVEDAD